MEGFSRDCSESFEPDLSSDNGYKSPHDYLCFFSKISDDLRAHFARDTDKEDFCEDIYEDIYSTPVSGSYSYYKDLLNVAEKTDTRIDNQKRTKFEFHEQPPSRFSEFFCSSACSGHLNPTVGTGPFEELFQVLEPTKLSCYMQAPGTFSYANSSTQWTQNSEAMGPMNNQFFSNSSLDDGYSDFIDIFHRWTSDSLPTDFPPYNPDNF